MRASGIGRRDAICSARQPWYLPTSSMPTGSDNSACSSTTRSCRRLDLVAGPTTSPDSPARPPTSSQFTDFGETWYRGLLLSATRRFGTSGDVRVSYTWSTPKTMCRGIQGRSTTTAWGATQPIRPACRWDSTPAREQGPADTDQPHRLVVSGTWSAPWRVERLGDSHGRLRDPVHAACGGGPQRRRPAAGRPRARGSVEAAQRRSGATPNGCRRRPRRTCAWPGRSGCPPASR